MKKLLACISSIAFFTMTNAYAGVLVNAEAKHILPTKDGYEIQIEFKINNHSPTRVNNILLGDTPEGDAPLLKASFTGWIDDTQIVSPQGWTGYIERLEESDLFSIVWRLDHEMTASYGIQANSTMGGFIVLLKPSDIKLVPYLSTTTVTIQGEDVISKVADKTAPVIKGHVRSGRSTSGHDTLQISPALETQDDLDPRVSMSLMSITPAKIVQPQVKNAWPIGKRPTGFTAPVSKGQSYTLTYLATDASGKTALCKVTIPAETVSDSTQPCLP